MGFMESPWRESWVNAFVMAELGLSGVGADGTR
jgi:hypothetical protein